MEYFYLEECGHELTSHYLAEAVVGSMFDTYVSKVNVGEHIYPYLITDDSDQVAYRFRIKEKLRYDSNCYTNLDRALRDHLLSMEQANMVLGDIGAPFREELHVFLGGAICGDITESNNDGYQMAPMGGS